MTLLDTRRPTPTSTVRRHSVNTRQRRSTRTFWIFTSPWTIGFVALAAIPMLFGLGLSFTNYSAVSTHWHFVGFANYALAFQDSEVAAAALRTVLIPVVVVPLLVGTGLLLALLANQNVRGRAVYRAIFYLPTIIPPLAAAVAFREVFDRDTGAVNAIIGWFGIGPVNWLSGYAVLVVLGTLLLWTVGGNMVLSLAALQDVPTDIIEASRLDGAGAIRRLWSIIIPIISPILFYQMFMGVIGALQIAIPALLLGGFSGGFPANLDTFMVYTLRQFWSFGRLGYGAALTWLMFLGLILIAAGMLRLSRRFVYYTANPDEVPK